MDKVEEEKEEDETGGTVGEMGRAVCRKRAGCMLVRGV